MVSHHKINFLVFSFVLLLKIFLHCGMVVKKIFIFISHKKKKNLQYVYIFGLDYYFDF